MSSTPYVAPFVPTPPKVLRRLSSIVSFLVKDYARQPVLYDGGCGNGLAASTLASSSSGYTICLELNELRAREALETVRRRRLGHLVDVVVGDVLSFSPRRIDIAYTFLMPEPMDIVAERLPQGTILISLNFPTTRLKEVAEIPVGIHTLYIYVKNG